MKVISYRIKNFRSITDTDWCNFSSDGVTVLVGQNESGKSAILEALQKTFSQDHITEDDIRFGCELPEISIKVQTSAEELNTQLNGKLDHLEIDAAIDHLSNKDYITDFIFSWSYEIIENKKKIIFSTHIDEPELDIRISENGVRSAPEGELLIPDIIATNLFECAPTFTIFQSSSGLLPNSIEIKEDMTLEGNGSIAANNLLTIAGITIQDLVTSDTRTRESTISRALEKINSDFSEFWNQTIGHDKKIKIEFSLEHHNNTSPEKSGKPYLLFWVTDGPNKLHPKQRSAGVRWFISFYLQLKASLNLNKNIHFLLDEPGANLHSNAQKDVLKLINLLSKEIPITYSTHSPHLIEHDKLYRVYAVQRKNGDPEKSTEVIDAHKLGAASSDTLSPILTAIGTDLSHQNVIQKDNNVILEEISGYYYISSFWQLTKSSSKAHFIAATGANKIPILVNMFTGWGLNFTVVVDDESQGRKVYNSLKRDLYGDHEEIAKKHLYKIKDCNGIEDIFSINDFKNHVLCNPNEEISKSPSEHIKGPNFSKPVLAYNFALKVKNGEILEETLETETINRIKNLVKEIENRLNKA